jgi:hypothetical protein
MNTQQIADELRKTWNKTTGTNEHQTGWEGLGGLAKKGYIAVAEKAVELCSEKQYRDLVVGVDTIQEGDEVWGFGTGPWHPVTLTECGVKYRLGYYRMRRPVPSAAEDQRKQIEHLEEHNKILSDDLRHTQATWDEVYSWIHTNVKGCMGKRCCDVALELLKGTAAKVTELEDEAKRLHDLWHKAEEKLNATQFFPELSRKNAEITRLTEKLEKAATYINALENDVAMLSNTKSCEITPKDTVFFQIESNVDADSAISASDVMKSLFPENPVVVLPTGMNLHAVAQING